MTREPGLTLKANKGKEQLEMTYSEFERVQSWEERDESCNGEVKPQGARCYLAIHCCQ